MARIWTDGFETGARHPGWVRVAAAALRSAIITTPVRTGGFAFRAGSTVSTSAERGEMWRGSLPTAQPQVFMRVGLQIMPSIDQHETLIRFRDSAAGPQAVLTYDHALARLRFWRGDRVAELGFAPMTTGAMHLLQMAYTPHSTLGAFRLLLNGVEVLNLVNVNTQATANANVQHVEWGSWTHVSAISQVDYDDIAINDPTGTVENGLPGSGGIVLLRPSANGQYSQLLGSDGNRVDNFALVQQTPTVTTSFVGSAVANERDSYVLSDVPVAFNTVVLAQPIVVGQLASTGTGSLRVTTRMAGVDRGHDTLAQSASWATQFGAHMHTAPNGDPWTVANINALELGVEVI